MIHKVRIAMIVCLLLSSFYACKKEPGIENPENVMIPLDPAFENALVKRGYDPYVNGVIRLSDVLKIDSLNFYGFYNLKNLKGIEHFVNLRALVIFDTKLDSLDLSKNVKLEYLSCLTVDAEDVTPTLTYLNLKNCKALKYLDCKKNLLSALDLTDNSALTYLNCSINPYLKELDLSNNVDLNYLNCSSIFNLKELDIHKNTKLRKILCSGTALTDLDMSLLPDLRVLGCEATNIKTLNLKAPELLEDLYIAESKITSVDFSMFPKLTSLAFGANLINPDLKPLKALKNMDCFGIEAAELDLSGNPGLENFSIRLSAIKLVDLANNSRLEFLYILGSPNLTSIDLRPAILLKSFVSSNNINLTKVCVNAIPNPSDTNWSIGDHATFSLCK